jgi:hypothetical protein
MTDNSRDAEILHHNQELLESVVRGDWERYASLCSADLTCFEAETNGVLVEGLPFHRFYFDLPGAATQASSKPPAPVHVSMARPHLRWLGDDAVVLTYTRLTQRLGADGPVTHSCCETRIWQKHANSWRHVHVHRS